MEFLYDSGLAVGRPSGSDNLKEAFTKAEEPPSSAAAAAAKVVAFIVSFEFLNLRILGGVGFGGSCEVLMVNCLDVISGGVSFCTGGAVCGREAAVCE